MNNHESLFVAELDGVTYSSREEYEQAEERSAERCDETERYVWSRSGQARERRW